MSLRSIAQLCCLTILLSLAQGCATNAAEGEANTPWLTPAQLSQSTNVRPLQECDRWAAGDINNALQAAGIDSSTTDINIASQYDPALGPQAFNLAVNGPKVSLTGGDATGVMYGCFELAEQISNQQGVTTWPQLALLLHSTTQHPFLELRGDNAFLHTTTSKSQTLIDVPMWDAYIDMLARSRFNLLDLHVQYDLAKTSFPSLYPLTVHLDDYSKIGDPAIQAKNIADLKAVVAHAKDRGVHIAIMNYSAGAPGLAKSDLADYTTKVVAEFLRQVPDLYMIGFRVGESGQKDAFYESVYPPAAAAAGRSDIPLYTRTWGTKRADLQEIASKSPGGFNIEIKFNGEQLGLPYQGIHGIDAKRNPAYSYQDYLDVPSNYRIIWQIRANGTHRWWDWESTDFIRRTVNACTFGNSRGFSLEPQIAYYPYDAADYFNQTDDQSVYQYIFQKRWMWYLAWGRLGYDPNLPEQTLIAAYEHHFGPSGERIYHAVQEASKIVPLVTAYRYQGPDQRDYSPETETGLGRNSAPTTRATTTSSKKPRKTPTTRKAASTRPAAPQLPMVLRFASNPPMDGRSYAGISRYVDDKLHNLPDGSISPAQVADLFSSAAKATRDDIDQVPQLDGRAGDEWRLLRADLLCASYLGDYHADRILGTTHLLYAIQGDSQPDYDAGVQLMAASRDDWKKLSDIADATYAPFTDNLRGEKHYRWSNGISALATADAGAQQVWTQRHPLDPAKPLDITQSDLGKPTGIDVENLAHSTAASQATVSCDVTASNGIAKVILWHKDLPSINEWSPTAMKDNGDGHYYVAVPLTPHGLLYQIEVQDQQGQAIIYPNPLKETPYRAITPAELQQK